MSIGPELLKAGGGMLSSGFDLFGDALGITMRAAGAGSYAGGAAETREAGRATRDDAVSGIQTATESARQDRSYARGDYITEAKSNNLRPGESFATATGLREDVLARLRADRKVMRDHMGSSIREARSTGQDIVASVTDNLGQRIGALSQSLKGEQDQAFVGIDSEMAAGNLTPAAAAEMKQKVRLDGARRVGDEGAAIASDFSELKTQRMAEGADRVATLQSKFGELETAFDLGQAEVGSVMNQQVLDGINSDRDFARSLYDVTLAEIESSKMDSVAEAATVFAMTLKEISFEDSQNLNFASMLAGIPPNEWSFDPGEVMSGIGDMWSQRRAARDAKPD